MSIADLIAGQMSKAGKDRSSTATTTITNNEETGILDALLPIAELLMYATMFSEGASGTGGGSGASDIAKAFSLAAPGVLSGVPQFDLSKNYGAAPISSNIDPMAIADFLFPRTPAPIQLSRDVPMADNPLAPILAAASAKGSVLPPSPSAMPAPTMPKNLGAAGSGIDPTVLMFLLQNIPAMQQLIKGGR